MVHHPRKNWRSAGSASAPLVDCSPEDRPSTSELSQMSLRGVSAYSSSSSAGSHTQPEPISGCRICREGMGCSENYLWHESTEKDPVAGCEFMHIPNGNCGRLRWGVSIVGCRDARRHDELLEPGR